MATITVEAHEIEGVRYYVEWELGAEDVFPAERELWRTAHERIGWLFNVEDALAAANGQSVEIADRPSFLAEFAKEGGEHGASLLVSALSGHVDDPEEAARQGKGLISFADGLGVYEGVTV